MAPVLSGNNRPDGNITALFLLLNFELQLLSAPVTCLDLDGNAFTGEQVFLPVARGLDGHRNEADVTGRFGQDRRHRFILSDTRRRSTPCLSWRFGLRVYCLGAYRLQMRLAGLPGNSDRVPRDRKVMPFIPCPPAAASEPDLILPGLFQRKRQRGQTVGTIEPVDRTLNRFVESARTWPIPQFKGNPAERNILDPDGYRPGRFVAAIDGQDLHGCFFMHAPIFLF